MTFRAPFMTCTSAKENVDFDTDDAGSLSADGVSGHSFTMKYLGFSWVLLS